MQLAENLKEKDINEYYRSIDDYILKSNLNGDFFSFLVRKLSRMFTRFILSFNIRKLNKCVIILSSEQLLST